MSGFSQFVAAFRRAATAEPSALDCADGRHCRGAKIEGAGAAAKKTVKRRAAIGPRGGLTGIAIGAGFNRLANASGRDCYYFKQRTSMKASASHIPITAPRNTASASIASTERTSG